MSRKVLVASFEAWIKRQVEEPFSRISSTDPMLTTTLLRNFGLKAYSENWTKNQFRDLLLGLGEKFPWVRPTLTAGWRLVSRWEMLEPSTPHTPIPEMWLHAALAICAAWEWHRTMLCLWLGFYALLRPGELCTLVRTDFLLPGDHEGLDILIRIRAPKRRAGGAKKEYSKIESVDIHPYFLFELNKLRDGEPLWPASPATLCRRFRLACRKICARPALFTLGSLRAGGATALFRRWNENLTKLQWRGRWTSVLTLAHYVQELTAARVTIGMGRAQKELIWKLRKELDGCLWELLHEAGVDGEPESATRSVLCAVTGRGRIHAEGRP